MAQANNFKNFIGLFLPWWEADDLNDNVQLNKDGFNLFPSARDENTRENVQGCFAYLNQIKKTVNATVITIITNHRHYTAQRYQTCIFTIILAFIPAKTQILMLAVIRHVNSPRNNWPIDWITDRLARKILIELINN